MKLKKNCLAFIFLLPVIMVGMNVYNVKEFPLSQCEQEVNRILNQGASLLEKKYNMKPVGETAAMPGQVVKFFGLDFKICGPISENEARQILIDASNELLSIINGNLIIRPYLENYPFTIKNVGINLFVVDSACHDLNHPHIGIASILKGELRYLTLSEKDVIPFKVTECIESYAEALAIINAQGNNKS